MLKKLFIFLIINNSILTQIEHYEVALINSLRAECTICENLFQLRQRLSKLISKKNQILARLNDWINNLPESLKKNQLKRDYVALENVANNIVKEYEHELVVNNYLKDLKDLIDKMDPLIDNRRFRLAHQDFFKTMQFIVDIQNTLKSRILPANYNEWLAKRLNV